MKERIETTERNERMKPNETKGRLYLYQERKEGNKEQERKALRPAAALQLPGATGSSSCMHPRAAPPGRRAGAGRATSGMVHLYCALPSGGHYYYNHHNSNSHTTVILQLLRLPPLLPGLRP